MSSFRNTRNGRISSERRILPGWACRVNRLRRPGRVRHGAPSRRCTTPGTTDPPSHRSRRGRLLSPPDQTLHATITAGGGMRDVASVDDVTCIASTWYGIRKEGWHMLGGPSACHGRFRVAPAEPG